MTTQHHLQQKPQPRRPHFSPRQLLTSEQLNREQAFHIATLRRALHGLAGAGVVYGYTLSCDQSGESENKQSQDKKGAIYIGCGLAFDHHGRQLDWCGGCITINDLAGQQPECEGPHTLYVHYAEHHVTGSSDCGGCDTDDVLWVDHRVVFTLKQGCQEKELDCFKTHKDCPDINDYVCERLGREPCYDTPEDLCPTQCDNWYYDPKHGIPLACVYIRELSQNSEKCGSQYGFCDDKLSVCEYRPFVYPNALLYELIRGDHLNYAQVDQLSWQQWILYNNDWSAPISWGDFSSRVNDVNGFVITFSDPIQTMTLNPGSIILSAVVQEARTDYWESRRIPLNIIPVDEKDNCATSVKLEFEENWHQSEILDQRSTLEYGAIIELTIRGALIRDKCGCMLDTRPLGYEGMGHECCQSLPGGDFVALFRVAPKSTGKKPTEYDADDQVNEKDIDAKQTE